MSTYAQNAFYVSAVVAFLCVLVYLKRSEFTSHGRNHYLPKLPLPPRSANNETEETLKLAVWRAPPAIQDYKRLGIEDTNESWWENRNSSKTVYIATFTGLANVLQTMASAYTIAYRENINMKIVFWRSQLSPATWDDLFAFPKVNFRQTFPDGETDYHYTKACNVGASIHEWEPTSKRIEWVKEKIGRGKFGCLESCCWREPSFPDSVLWFYKILRPEEYVQMRIDFFKRNQNWSKYQWVGVHVRRTDNIGNMRTLVETETQETLKGKINTTTADSMLPLSSYVTLMKHLQQSWPAHRFAEGPFQAMKPVKFYLAADNEHVKKQIAKEFDDDSVVFFDQDRVNIRMDPGVWSKKVAVIDLYLLASCQILIGTPFSTYSEAAHLIGGGLYLEPNFTYEESK